MVLSSVNNPAATAATQSPSSSHPVSSAPPGNGLGEMDFLKLLTTQLKQQDPMQPMDDTQMVSQMAQFSGLQETQQLNQNFNTFNHSMTDALDMQTLAQSSSLIGQVVFAGVDASNVTMGEVTEIRQQDGKLQAVVQLPDGTSQNFSLDQIQQVGATKAQIAGFQEPVPSTITSSGSQVPLPAGFLAFPTGTY